MTTQLSRRSSTDSSRISNPKASTRRSSRVRTNTRSSSARSAAYASPVTDVRAKFKFGGNRTQQHRDVIASNLGERGSGLDREARAYTLTRGAKKT